jgi:glutamate/tyrosine decarboxylase-like PLP-dependent enzyme
VARDTARRTRAAAGIPEGRLRVLVSDQAHSSIKNALNIVAMDAVVISTSSGRLDAEALAGIGEDLLEDVVAIVATAGTTNAGIIDDLDAVSSFARSRGIWMHVDAAYGGAGLLASSVRHLYSGIEHADSVVMDPHKWWFAPFDCAALMYREPRLARAVHTQDASYLDVIHESDDDFNPSDLAYHLTRRARGLALWFSLAVNGLDAYREAVESSITMAEFAAGVIRGSEHLELVREPGLSIVLFRRPGWGVADYNAWAQRLLAEQVAFVAHSSWRGEPVGRLVFLHPNTTEQMVREVLETLR